MEVPSGIGGRRRTLEVLVLELGAGTGRITLAMAQDGVSIHALDADAAMLDRLRRKLTLEVQQRVLVRVDDMRTFAAAERFP